MKVNLYYDRHDDNYYFRLNNKRVIIEFDEFMFLKNVFDLYCYYQDYKEELENKRGKRK